MYDNDNKNKSGGLSVCRRMTRRIKWWALIVMMVLFLTVPPVSFGQQSDPNEVLPKAQQKAIAEKLERYRKRLEELNKEAEKKKEEVRSDPNAVQKAQNILDSLKLAQGWMGLLEKAAAAGNLTGALLQEAFKVVTDLLGDLLTIAGELKELVVTMLRLLEGLLDDFINTVEGIIAAITKFLEELSLVVYDRQGAHNMPGTMTFNLASNPANKVEITIEPEIGYSSAVIQKTITAGLSGSFTVQSVSTSAPDVFDVQVISLNQTAPSVEILPGLYTGPNVQTLDPSHQSTGRGNLSTGEFTLTLFTRITNNLYPPENPILVCSRVRGTYDPATGLLTVTSEAGDFVNRQSIQGTLLSLGDDDSVSLGIPFEFEFAGQKYSQVYVGSNGYLTFGSGDTDPAPSVSSFLSGPPRIAGAWTDLNPADPCSIVFYDCDPNHMTVFYRNVPSHSGGGNSSFSITIAKDGSFFVHNLGIAAASPLLCGYSLGGEWTHGSEAEVDISDPNYLMYPITPQSTAIYEYWPSLEPIDIPTLFGCKPSCCPVADLNEDRVVNIGDFVILAQYWLEKSSP